HEAVDDAGGHDDRVAGPDLPVVPSEGRAAADDDHELVDVVAMGSHGVPRWHHGVRGVEPALPVGEELAPTPALPLGGLEKLGRDGAGRRVVRPLVVVDDEEHAHRHAPRLGMMCFPKAAIELMILSCGVSHVCMCRMSWSTPTFA